MTNYVPFTRSSARVFDPEDVFRVFYLEAPISILGEKKGLSLSPNPIELNGYHTAVGFQSTNAAREYEFYLDFLSEEISFKVIFPQVVNGELVWNNQSQITIGLSIERDYWTQSTYVCNITGNTLNLVQSWILDYYKPMNPVYAYFRTCIGLNRKSIFNPYLRSSICDDFCFAIFDFFQKNGTCIDFVTPLSTDISALIIRNENQAVLMNYENPKDKAEILAFYSVIPSIFNNFISQSLLEVLKSLQELLLASSIIGNRNNLNLTGFSGALLKSFIPYMILRTYWTTGAIEYVKVYFDDVYINYIESDLKRNVFALDLNGALITDEYTVAGSVCSVSNCQTRNTCVPGDSGIAAVSVVSIFLMILIAIIFFLIGYYIRK